MAASEAYDIRVERSRTTNATKRTKGTNPVKLTNKLRHRLLRAVKREWSDDPQLVADMVAAIEHVRHNGGVINLDGPEYNGDASLSDPNGVVVQLVDYFFGIGNAQEAYQ